MPDALKAAIAQVAALEGKSVHAVMVYALPTAMDDALARQQFYLDAEAASQDTLQSNRVYAAQGVKAFVLARAQGGKPGAPNAEPFDSSRPMWQT